MKVNKFNFLKVIGEQLAEKFGASSSEIDPNILVTSLAPSFTPYISIMKANRIMNDNELIDLDKLETAIRKFFIYVPTLNIPLGKFTISITLDDALKVITKAEHFGICEDIICLPCQN